VRDDLETEIRLGNNYVTVLTNASCTFQGRERTLSEMSRFSESTDRQERREALDATWSAVDANSADLDRIFDELVDCRVRIAAKLGYATFMDLAYDRLGRVDYGPSDVATFRREILGSIVPTCRALAENQAKSIGVDTLMPWDENVYDDGATIHGPSNGLDALRAIQPVFAKMHTELGRFIDAMMQKGLFDLDGRPAKAGGSFCSFLPQVGMPFVFGSFGGTSRDLTSVVHEMGHAFQNFQSRRFPVLEHVIPTNEVGEIHSLALEFLIWPHCREFFSNDSERYKARHLRSLIGMLPYIAAVDHFQEAIYQQPHLRPGERHAVWLEMEALYMPWRAHGGIPGLARGARWQLQRHIYRFPFYYIDYGLALCCALQLWDLSLTNYDGAMQAYVSLCKRGGSMPFRALMDASGLKSPFEGEALRDVADQALSLIAKAD
jgi:M3 family oligoendopeptidase